MDKERNWIYDKDVCMPDVRCDSYPIFVKDDYVVFNVILSDKDEYYIEVGIKDGEKSIERSWFVLSMERPAYVQEPPRNLTNEEKMILEDFARKKWAEIVGTIYVQCNADCVLRGGGCDKFCNRPIPVIPPDYTLLPDLY